MEIVALIFTIVALIPIVAYLCLQLFYKPKISIRVGGDQQGNKIINVLEKGEISFAICASTKFKTYISEIWVNFNNIEVDLSKTKGAETRITTERQFPVSILFSGLKTIKVGYLQANFFSYNSISENFSIKITVRVETDEADLPFLLTMFPSPKVIFERIVEFKVVKGMISDLNQLGLKLNPGESIQVEGVQSQEAVYVNSEKALSQIKIIEICKE
jgi:hypothetical protein